MKRKSLHTLDITVARRAVTWQAFGDPTWESCRVAKKGRVLLLARRKHSCFAMKP